MSLLDAENTIIESIDERLEFEYQLRQSIQRLFDIFNKSMEND